MAIPLLGEPGRSTFNRSFFNVRMEELLQRAGGTATTQVLLYLTDGMRLGLCHVEEMNDDYMVVRGYRNEPGCELTLHVIPYALIYRMEIDPTGGQQPQFGFRASPRDPNP